MKLLFLAQTFPRGLGGDLCAQAAVWSFIIILNHLAGKASSHPSCTLLAVQKVEQIKHERRDIEIASKTQLKLENR